MSDKITLDRETFKALAADTRVDILKKLGEHKLTLTDIASQMRMSPSTIKEHLDRLVEVGLIEQEDKGMKWKYYRLTDKGKNIVSPYETKVWILLGTSLLVLAGSALSLASKLASTAGLRADRMAASAPSAALMRSAVKEKANDAAAAALQSAQGATAAAKVAETTTTFAYEAVGGGVRLLSQGMDAANETLRDAADKGLMMAKQEGLMTASREAASGAYNAPAPGSVTVTTSTIMETTTTTLQAASQGAAAAVQSTTTTLQAAASALLHEAAGAASQAAAASPPYLEMALVGASLVVVGLCAGYLLRKKLILG